MTSVPLQYVTVYGKESMKVSTNISPMGPAKPKNFIQTRIRKFQVGTRLLLFLVLMLLAILVTVISFSRYYARKVADQYVYEYLQAEHKRVVNSIELYLEEIIMVSLRYKNTNAFYDILQDTSLLPNEKEAALQEAAQSIQPPVSSSIGNVYLIDNDSSIYLISDQVPGFPYPDITVLDDVENNPYYHIGNTVQDGNGQYYLPLSMRFYNYHTFQDLGCLVFYLPQEPISRLYDELLATSGYTFIVDENGAIVSHSDSSLIGTQASLLGIPLSSAPFAVTVSDVDNRESIIVSTAFSSGSSLIGFSWRLVSVLPYNDLFYVLDQILHALLAAGLVVIVCAVFVSYFISNKLTRSLKRLRDRLHDLSRGKLNAFLDSNPRDELWDLEQGYNEMVVKINDLLEKNRLEQEKKRELELTALQAQINPHFLYNTLDAIGWIAVMKGQNEIEQMVMELSRFFRLSLHKGDKRITIEDEIGIAASYVAIEQLRNPGKFDVEYDIQLEITQLLVPKIILQPIVENAIKHGVSQVRRHGLITIRGYRDNDDVYLEVKDNGKGFCEKSSHVHGSGYGLKNVNERIQLEYGPEYGISIQSKEGAGTSVLIHLSFFPGSPSS